MFTLSSIQCTVIHVYLIVFMTYDTQHTLYSMFYVYMYLYFMAGLYIDVYIITMVLFIVYI